MSAAGSLLVQPVDRVAPSLVAVAEAYVAAGDAPAARRCRRAGVVGFTGRFGDLDGWLSAPVPARCGVRTEVMSFAAHAIVRCHVPVDPTFVVTSGCRWGKYVRDAYPGQAATFAGQAADLGFGGTEIRRMWAYLAKICVVAGEAPDQLSPGSYQNARTAVHDAVIAVRGYRPTTLSTPLFGLDAVMFHRRQAAHPDIRRRWTGRPVHEVNWADLTARAPQLVATMRRYLDQCALSLRASSVVLFDTTLRQFADVLTTADPPVGQVAAIRREHVEAYKTRLVERPGYHGRALSKTTIGMRMGHLRTFFTRIAEWGYHDSPERIPVFASDRQRPPATGQTPSEVPRRRASRRVHERRPRPA